MPEVKVEFEVLKMAPRKKSEGNDFSRPVGLNFEIGMSSPVSGASTCASPIEVTSPRVICLLVAAIDGVKLTPTD